MKDPVAYLTACLTAVQKKNTWKPVHAYLQSRQVLHFKESGLGGTFRDIYWAYFKPQYIRKDGTVIPVWGGVRKVRGKGLVKAKKRSKNPGGKRRYREGDLLMQHTGLLRNALLADFRFDGKAIILTTPLKYAARQNALRPFNFISDEEHSAIVEMIDRELEKC